MSDDGEHLLVDLPLAVVLGGDGPEVDALGGLVDLDVLFLHVGGGGGTKRIKNKTNNGSGYSLIKVSAESN